MCRLSSNDKSNLNRTNNGPWVLWKGVAGRCIKWPIIVKSSSCDSRSISNGLIDYDMIPIVTHLANAQITTTKTNSHKIMSSTSCSRFRRNVRALLRELRHFPRWSFCVAAITSCWSIDVVALIIDVLTSSLHHEYCRQQYFFLKDGITFVAVAISGRKKERHSILANWLYVERTRCIQRS